MKSTKAEVLRLRRAIRQAIDCWENRGDHAFLSDADAKRMLRILFAALENK